MDIEREIKIPLYYTGLTDRAVVKEQDGEAVEYILDRNYFITIIAKIPAKGYNWYIIE